MREVRGAELKTIVERTWNMTTPPLTVLVFLLAKFKRKSLESCEKDVKRLSKVNQKLCQVATERRAAL